MEQVDCLMEGATNGRMELFRYVLMESGEMFALIVDTILFLVIMCGRGLVLML